MNNESHYVLAMYDVRGKQKFIYRSRKIKEIVGGSGIIANIYNEYLFPAAEVIASKEFDGLNMHGIYSYQNNSIQDSIEQFSIADLDKRLSSDQDGYLGEVVYDGGGNFLVIYRDAETCIKINRLFSRNILENVGSLHVLCTFIGEGSPYDSDPLILNDYKKDRERLYSAHRTHEAQESVLFPVNTTPFVRISPETGRPFTHRKNINGKSLQVTDEEYAKYNEYQNLSKDVSKQSTVFFNQKYLDRMVKEKGKESLLAVIYIDGNSMGARVQQILDNKKTYEECVNQLRQFSEQINKDFIVDRMKEIPVEQIRSVVGAGDEITIICRADEALKIVEEYFNGLQKTERNSSCAGIVVFHSHAPFSDAYRIAEECCENAKKMMKRADLSKEQTEHVNLIDFHFCQNGIGYSLEKIRDDENLNEINSKPWMITFENGSAKYTPIFTAEQLKEEVELPDINELCGRISELARTNIKDLRAATQISLVSMLLEIERIKAHQDIDLHIEGYSAEQLRRVLYDVTVMYDLWFAKKDGDVNAE